MAQGKILFAFFLCPNRYAAVDVSRKVGAAYQNDCATKRGRYL